MSKITLYSARACPYAHRTRLVLAEKRLPFELVEIDLQAKPNWFQSVSSYGKVPVLAHAETTIWESAVINEYLDEVFKEPALLPASAAQRALARIWIDYANTHFARSFDALLRSVTESERKSAQSELEASLRYIVVEGLAKAEHGGPFFLGEELSLVDFTFYPWFERWDALQYYRGFAIPSQLGRLHAWRGAVRSLDTVKDQASPAEFHIERYAGAAVTEKKTQPRAADLTQADRAT